MWDSFLASLSAESFHVPFWLDILALFLVAVTGAIRAVERGYDVVGALTLALAAGSGGGILRDLLLNTRPFLLTDGNYLAAILLSVVAVTLFARYYQRGRAVFEVADALGLAIYAVVGTIKGIHSGLSFPAAVLLGAVNATGGGILRDILTREEPSVLKPGQWYVLVALFGSVTFGGLVLFAHAPSMPAGLFAVLLTFVLRLLVLRYNWRTRPLATLARVEPANPDAHDSAP